MTKLPGAIKVIIREKPFPNPHGAYTIYVGGRVVEVDQRCINRLNDLVEGEWDVEFDGGAIVLYGSYLRSKPPRVCDCGKRIPFNHRWCDDCLNGILWPATREEGGGQ